ncbi:MAG: DUF4149 domain-containing protein [Pseudomonadota bacterium]
MSGLLGFVLLDFPKGSFEMPEFAALVSVFSLAMLLGGMVFFPSVVAPTVFRSLDTDRAGKFLRDLFPAYYAFIIFLSAIALVSLYTQLAIAIGLMLVIVSTLLVRQLLVPAINSWRDQELAGIDGAARKFALGHRISVVINMAQLVFVAWALYQLVRS